MVKNLPAMQEMWVCSLGREDPLGKEMQLTPVFLPGKSHGQRPRMATVCGIARVRHDLATNYETLTFVRCVVLVHFPTMYIFYV